VYPTVLVRVAPRWLGEDMSSDNPPGADNQQERPSSSFSVSFVRITESLLEGRNPQRPYAELLLEARRMKRWSMPHGDMRKTVQNYNRPKVAKFLVG
jgi:hypothetical protein